MATGMAYAPLQSAAAVSQRAEQSYRSFLAHGDAADLGRALAQHDDAATQYRQAAASTSDGFGRESIQVLAESHEFRVRELRRFQANEADAISTGPCDSPDATSIKLARSDFSTPPESMRPRHVVESTDWLVHSRSTMAGDADAAAGIRKLQKFSRMVLRLADETVLAKRHSPGSDIDQDFGRSDVCQMYMRCTCDVGAMWVR